MVARDILIIYKRKRSQSESLALLQSGKSHAGWWWSEIAFIALSTGSKHKRLQIPYLLLLLLK